MPKKNDHGIHVSTEEERYLRRAFRRFALPYLLLVAVVTWAAASLTAPDDSGASPEAVAELREEVAALQETIAGLEGRFAAIDAGMAKSGKRLATLERAPAAGNASSLEPELRETARRIAGLEKQIAEQAATERLDALAARMTRLERERRENPPLPAALAPPPAAPREPAPAPLPLP